MPALVAKLLPLLLVIGAIWLIYWLISKLRSHVETEYYGDWVRFIVSRPGSQLTLGVFILLAAVIVFLSRLFSQ
jgi:hypothetical protein